MPKIRDLGINVIPVTMRPPEIGPGGAFMQQDLGPCAQETDCENESCDPSGECLPSCDQGSRAPGYRTAGFSDGAVAQLRQQMQSRLVR